MIRKTQTIQKSREELLLVIDGNNAAYRAKYTFNLSNKGEDVSVTYGFLRMLSSLLEKFKPTSVVVAWDRGIPEFRRKMVPEYKANRHLDTDPDERADFIRQMDELSDYVLPMAGVVSISNKGSEADDIIYHMSRLSSIPVIVVSSDKDLFQCINDNVRVYHPASDMIHTKETIEEKYGISINDYIHWRAIQGDSSDNIPGVQDVGEKTATKLFDSFGTLCAIENAVWGRNPNGNITGKLKDSFMAFGSDRISKNVYIMALYADRTGVRKTIYDSIMSYKEVNKERLTKYLMHKAFASLTTFPGELSKPSQPKLIPESRFPIVCTKERIPC